MITKYHVRHLAKCLPAQKSSQPFLTQTSFYVVP